MRPQLVCDFKKEISADLLSFFISGRLAGVTLTFDFLSRVTIHFLYTVIPMLSKITVVDLVQNSPTVWGC